MIESEIQRAIDELSKFQEKLKKDLQNLQAFTGFSETEKLVSQALRTGEGK